jgi:hypothetical protein
VVPSEYLLSKIPGVAPQLPLMHAPFRAEREAPGRHFEVAPAAESAPVCPCAEGGGFDAASRHRSTRLHENILAMFCFGRRRGSDWRSRVCSALLSRDHKGAGQLARPA